MLKDLEEETGLNAELCSYIVNIIMEDYQKLQLNFIIDSLQELQNRWEVKRISLFWQKSHFTVLWEEKGGIYHEFAGKMEGYLEYCIYRKELDVKTVKAYRIDLNQFFSFTCCDEPEKETIERYITDLHKKYKQKTVKRKIASVKAFYSYLEEEELLEQNPFRKIKVKFKETIVLPRIIPRDEIEQLLNYMYTYLNGLSGIGYKYGLRDVAVVELFFATGARVYEISNIRNESMDWILGVYELWEREEKNGISKSAIKQF